MRSRSSLIVAAVVSAMFVLAGVASADPPPGALVQLAPPAACLSTTAAGGCSPFGSGIGVSGAQALAVSDDGRDVYVGGVTAGESFLSRSATGALTAFGGSDAVATFAYATHGAGLFGGTGMNSVDNGGVTAFARDASGTPVLVNRVADRCAVGASSADCLADIGLFGVTDVAVAPDGRSLYAAGEAGGGNLVGALTTFTIDSATQAITEVQCVPSERAALGFCDSTPAPALKYTLAVVTSPDGKFVYASGEDKFSVVGFNVVQGGANAGQIGSQVDCLWAATATSDCRQVPAVGQPDALAISPDGRDLYAASLVGGVSVLHRDVLSGVLAFTQCISAAGGDPCTADPALTGVTRDVAVSPDGRSVYVAGGDGGQGGYVISYARDASTGALTRIGCVTNFPTSGCTTAAGLADAVKLAVSPDGAFVYVTAHSGGDGRGAVAAFRVQPPVVACPLSGSPCPGPPLMDRIAPRSRVSGLKRRVKAKALRGFRGTASDDHAVARVAISLVRLQGGARIARATCSALTSHGRFHALKMRRGRCSVSGFLRAKGTTRWSFALKHRLPKGSYVLTVRATDAAGNMETSFSSHKGDRVAFTVT
jgi:6-phosphogluconolactonase (cycloisomerase 2 family)